MSFPAYSEYKESGVEWLGDIPSHWSVRPLKWLARVDNAGTYGAEPDGAEVTLPVATTAQITKDGRFDVNRMSERSFSPSEIRQYKCDTGDILVVKSSGSADNVISGKAGIVLPSTPPFVFSNFLLRLQPIRDRCLPFFLFHLVQSNLTRERVKQMCSTTTYPNLQVGLYVSAKLPLPPVTEQEQILSFLRQETARIDALIEEQQRLIDLLKEKRQAVISHAVTKGLDPDVPMKDSGVEWLGEVPEHWHVVKLGWRVSSRSGDGLASTEVEKIEDDEHHISVIGGNGILGYTDGANLEQESVVVGRVGALCGNVHHIEGPAWVTDNAIFLTRISGFLPSYLCLVLRAADLNRHASLTAQPLLTGESIRQEKVPAPCLDEQKLIVERVERAAEKMDSLMQEAETVIATLRERKSALISAAVTGKIDVRNWQPPKGTDESQAAANEDIRA